jgi:hypothetical protein
MLRTQIWCTISRAGNNAERRVAVATIMQRAADHVIHEHQQE